MQSSVIRVMKEKKYLKLYRAIQESRNGQWWSNFNTHLSQTRQCFDRKGLGYNWGNLRWVSEREKGFWGDRYVAGWAKGGRVTIARLKERDQTFWNYITFGRLPVEVSVSFWEYSQGLCFVLNIDIQMPMRRRCNECTKRNLTREYVTLHLKKIWLKH